MAFVELKRVTPEGLTAEGFITEDLLAIVKHCPLMARNLRTEIRLRRRGSGSDHSDKQIDSAHGCRKQRRDHKERF